MKRKKFNLLHIKMERHKDIPVKITVRAIILNSECKVLLTKRAFSDHEGGRWCLPGGKSDKKEDAIKAVHRELLEEVGIETSLNYYKEINNSNTSTGIKWVTYYFVGHSNTIPTNLQQEEVSETGYYSKDEVLQLDIAFDHKVVLMDFFNQS